MICCGVGDCLALEVSLDVEREECEGERNFHSIAECSNILLYMYSKSSVGLGNLTLLLHSLKTWFETTPAECWPKSSQGWFIMFTGHCSKTNSAAVVDANRNRSDHFLRTLHMLNSFDLKLMTREFLKALVWETMWRYTKNVWTCKHVFTWWWEPW